MALRITQSGVVLTVGIILLAIIVLSGLWLAKNHGEQVRRDAAIKVAEQSLQEQSQDAPKPEDESSKEGSNQQNGGNNQNEDSQSTNSNGNDVNQLPQTGPNDLINLFAVAALVFASSAYVVSLRRL